MNNPFVEAAANTAMPRVLDALREAGRPVTLIELAALVDEDRGLVAATVKRLERHGHARLDRASRTIVAL